VNHRFLLDTQAFLWAIQDEKLLSKPVRTLFSDQNNHLFLSLASIWEMQIKVNIHKLKLSKPLPDVIQLGITSFSLEILSIQTEHIYRQSGFPQHHRDPFDRLLIAQALQENMQVIGNDAHWDAYGVKRIW
jgi:PIN domain nuclease of toxin-antitoxin system